MLKQIVKNKHVYVLLLPTIIWFALFAYKPMYGLIVAFLDYSPFKGISGSAWVGMENFKRLIDGPYFFNGVKNTVLLSFYGLVLVFPLPIILAILFDEMKNSMYKRGIQTIMFVPHFISDVVLAGIVIAFLSPSIGIVNHILDFLGFERIYFMILPQWFRTVFIGSGIWKEVGFNSIVFTAAIASVNTDLYEAARIDGANRFKQIMTVTIPGIMPTIVTMFILRIGNIFTVSFEKVILLQQPATYSTSDVLSTYVYRSGIEQGDFAIATAGGLFEAVIALVFVVGANIVSKKAKQNSLW